MNFDVAKNVETHIHRIGRTGRMGIDGVQPGKAYTLITNSESGAAIDLIKNLRVSKQPIPPELQRLAESNPKYHSAMNPRREKQTGGLGFGGASCQQMTSQMAAEMTSGGAVKRNYGQTSSHDAERPRKSRFSSAMPPPARPAVSVLLL